MNRKAVKRIFAVTAAAGIITIAGSVAAADIRQGRIIAERWCAACHFIDGRPSATDAVPPFAQMANDPMYTEARLRNWLADPHPPMPKLELDRYATDDVIAYIRSLKR